MRERWKYRVHNAGEQPLSYFLTYCQPADLRVSIWTRVLAQHDLASSSLPPSPFLFLFREKTKCEMLHLNERARADVDQEPWQRRGTHVYL